jgi:hypothetical protein
MLSSFRFIFRQWFEIGPNAQSLGAGGLFLSRWRGIWIIFAILEHLTEAFLDAERANRAARNVRYSTFCIDLSRGRLLLQPDVSAKWKAQEQCRLHSGGP